MGLIPSQDRMSYVKIIFVRVFFVIDKLGIVTNKISMTEIEELFELVDRYADAKGLTESSVSVQIFNDGKRMRVLRAGGDIGVRRMRRAVQLLSKVWPADLPWPKAVKRPPL